MKIQFYSSTEEILRELGSRLKAIRIERMMTQEELAEQTNLARRTISNLESGKDISFATVIEVMRALGQLQNLDLLVPEQTVRPSQLLTQKKPRERATSKKYRPDTQSGWKWGDES